MANLLVALGEITEEQLKPVVAYMERLGHVNSPIVRITKEGFKDNYDLEHPLRFGDDDLEDAVVIIHTYVDETDGVWENLIEIMPICTYFVVGSDGVTYFSGGFPA